MYQQLSNDVRDPFFSISIVLHYLLLFHPHAYCPMVAKWLLQLPYHIHIQQKANKEVTELINFPLQLFFSSTSKRCFSEISYHISHYQKSGHLVIYPPLRSQEIKCLPFQPHYWEAEREKMVQNSFCR